MALSWPDALAYLPTQILGCGLGAVTANAMFALAATSISHRTIGPAPPHLLAETVATLGLVLVIFALARTHRDRTGARRGRRVHRRRLLVHQLEQLR